MSAGLTDIPRSYPYPAVVVDIRGGDVPFMGSVGAPSCLYIITVFRGLRYVPPDAFQAGQGLCSRPLLPSTSCRDTTVPGGAETFRDLSCALSRRLGRAVHAGLHGARVSPLSRMRHPRPRLCQGALRSVRSRFSHRLFM